MIDDMIDVLHKEQGTDDQKKEYCATEFDKADDKKKGLEKTVSDEEAAMSRAEEAIATLTDELAALAAGIAELDKSVAQATAQRQEEHSDYTELMSSDTQAKDLLGVAKNRLNKFYQPKLYIDPPKMELTREEAVYQTVVPAEPAFMQQGVAPPPPPETFGAYTKKTQESTGVITMIDMLAADLDKEMQEATA